MEKIKTTYQADLICFCHLRWNFVYQRPQHLLSRFAKYRRVFVIEEPLYDAPVPWNEIVYNNEANLWNVIPHLPAGMPAEKSIAAQKVLLDMLMERKQIENYLLWYYSPMALQFTSHLTPAKIIYDCMDELSAFKFAPPALKQNEAKLFKKADIVFTGGHHLYEAKKDFHANIFPMPSSIDRLHFEQARDARIEAEDQKAIPHPRIGFYGVVDERFDTALLEQAALQKPGWQFVIIGPVVKIDPASLPQQPNIHYLGARNYKELPAYLAGWDIAMMPFALNEATRYISPTKTPEYLAGGKPVISTSIRDVVIPYGEKKLVHIADTADDFVAVAEKILAGAANEAWLKQVDDFLEGISWDITWGKMNQLIERTVTQPAFIKIKTESLQNERAHSEVESSLLRSA